MKGRLRFAVAAAAIALLGAPLAHAGILDDVKERKELRCGVNPGLAGFSMQDASENWSGFDVDYCRAIAAAVLGDPTAVAFVPLTTRDRFRELQSGKIDVLVRDTAWTMARDTAFGLTFAGVNYYSGIGFMVPKTLGVDSALQLTGARICLEAGTAAEKSIAEYFATRGMTYEPVPVADPAALHAAYEDGNCNVATGELVSLYSMRLTLADPDASIVLPELLSKEPYGPVVLRDDAAWLAVVKWVHFALLNAEELGVTSANVDTMLTAPSEDVRNLLGSNGAFGEALGLTNDWAAAAIRAVGNYGEIFDRNLGEGSELKIARGLNALWINGGIQFAPPVR